MAVIDKIKSALHKDDNAHAAPHAESTASSDQPSVDLAGPEQVAFDDKLVTVIFVLGGPGAGVYTTLR